MNTLQVNNFRSRSDGLDSADTSLSLMEKSSYLEAPLGDHDRREKVQICIELREQIQHKAKKKIFQLDVVVMQIKNLCPVKPGKLPSPYVKLRLNPGNEIMSTELKKTDQKNVYFYGEPFTFSGLKSPDLAGKTIEVQVCDKKVTRQAYCFGGVTIPLDGFQVGKPSAQWYHLEPVPA